MSRIALAAVAAVLALAACDNNNKAQTPPQNNEYGPQPPPANQGQPNAQLDQEAIANYQDLVAGRDDALVARASSTIDPNAIRQSLANLRQMVGTATPPQPSVMQFGEIPPPQGPGYWVVHSYTYPDKVVYVNTGFKQEGGAWKVLSFNLNVAGPGGQMGPTPPAQPMPAPAPTA